MMIPPVSTQPTMVSTMVSRVWCGLWISQPSTKRAAGFFGFLPPIEPPLIKRCHLGAAWPALQPGRLSGEAATGQGRGRGGEGEPQFGGSLVLFLFGGVSLPRMVNPLVFIQPPLSYDGGVCPLFFQAGLLNNLDDVHGDRDHHKHSFLIGLFQC